MLLRRKDLSRCDRGEPGAQPVRGGGENQRAHIDPAGWQLCDLVETGRTIEGVAFKPIEDPDLYRALVDIAQVAEECRDLLVFERLRPFLDLARFRLCPACLDRFDSREDCPTCSGHGFVTNSLATGLL